MPRTRSKGLAEEDVAAAASDKQPPTPIPPRVFDDPPQSPSYYGSANPTALPPGGELRNPHLFSLGPESTPNPVPTATETTAPAAAQSPNPRPSREGSVRARSKASSAAAARARAHYETERTLAGIRENLARKKLEMMLAQIDDGEDAVSDEEDELEATVRVQKWLDTSRKQAHSPVDHDRGRPDRPHGGATVDPPPRFPQEGRNVRGEGYDPRDERGEWRDPPRYPQEGRNAREERHNPRDERGEWRDSREVRGEWRDSRNVRGEGDQPRRERRKALSPPYRRRSTDRAIEYITERLDEMDRSRPPPRAVIELPHFSGPISEWLPFKRALIDSTRLYKFTDAENMVRLQVSLKGAAKEAVAALLYTARSPSVVMETLEQKFGRPEVIVDDALEAIARLPSPGESAREFHDFATSLRNIVSILDSIDEEEHLRNPLLVRDVIKKLSPYQRNRWARYANKHGYGGNPPIVALSHFLVREADVDLRHAYTKEEEGPPKKESGAARAAPPPRPPRRRVERDRKANVYVAAATDDRDVVKPVCLCCGGTHCVPDCKKFAAMTIDERWKWLKESNVCFKCLKDKHRRYKCKAKPCGTGECRAPHHALLHKEKPKEETVLAASVVVNRSQQSVLLKVCPVVVTGPNGRQVESYAMMDEGSTVTLIDSDLAKCIEANGPTRALRLHGLGPSQREPKSQVVRFEIRGVGVGESYDVCARTVQGLSLSRQSIDRKCLDYEHLRDLPTDKICYNDAKPGILIGSDNWHLIVTRQLLAGRNNEPAASLTLLGWTVHGTVPRRMVAQRVSSEGETVLHMFTRRDSDDQLGEPAESDERLDELVRRHFSIDALGITSRDSTMLSRSEQRAVEIFARTAKRLDNCFEVGLPWRDDDTVMPPSYEMALRRLRSIERRMDASPEFKREYTAQINNLLDKGYASLCEGYEESSPVSWYLPHFAVRNPNKPGKVRLVHDAAATVNGTSLNDRLLDGPDMLRSLPGILFRFRERAVAVTADIREMFMRVKIRKEDQPAQMFLWRGEDRDRPPDRYKMTSMIFGARSSPFLAHSVRDLNANEHKDFYPVAYEAITRNHYVDDWVDSYQDEIEAVRAVLEVIAVHSRAGFHLAGWNSNSKLVLDHLPDDVKAQAPKSLGDGNSNQSGKTLGLLWMAKEDKLCFNTSFVRVPREVRALEKRPTKREALSAVMSIFDPLGLLSYFTVRAKIVLQNIWRAKIGWDDEIPDDAAQDFHDWLRDVNVLGDLRLDRYYGHDANVVGTELHVFSDASELAYATAAYLRFVYKDGSVKVTLAAAKAKVTPLRAPSIPRLELQANLIGARVADSIVREHRIKIDKVVLWSDSRTALHWIRNDTPRYTPYVAHRLSEISELTSYDQWRWIPTDLNVADDATRLYTGVKKCDDRWFTGPSFLYESEETWPTEDEETEVVGEDEVVVNYASEGGTYDYLPDISRFSSYERLIRATARVLAFVDMCRKRANRVELRHIEEAERRWIARAQSDDFGEEIAHLSRGKPIPRTSRIAKLDPMVGEDGLLRVNGRINAAANLGVEKRPIILDGRHAFTRLLILNEHRRAGHAGNERVTNDIRLRFHVLRLRPTVRKVARECRLCRYRKCAPSVPAHGNLPLARLDTFSPPFTNTGVDYFGPMNVTIGRRHEKRWGALFTCLTTRAVHIELVASLSTDSAIMALRRMAARRGWPRVIFSDNATNFRGADTELRAAVAEWEPALREFALTNRTEWRFIDPGAPNQGGAWERLVRSVKTALAATLHTKAPKEEVLRTLLTEAEYSINARPLTHVPVDPAEPEALTPNHFLLGRPNALPVVGTCEEADRRQWRVAQAIADEFWRRWVKEYLPTLIPRGSPTDTTKNIKKGDLVIIVDPSLPRNVWPRGEVIEEFVGPDGTTRSVDVRTRGGVFRRPVRRLAVLPTEDRSS